METFNGDSGSILVEDSSFSLDQLQPGRNYSVVVAAVSNNIDSNNNELMYQATSKFSNV